MIKWITDQIATAPFDKVDSKNIDAVIVDVRDLVDKAGNQAAEINKKIHKALDLLKAGRKIIICCDYGMSRSNAIAIGVISKWDSISFNDAVKKVLKATSEKQIKLEVLRVVREALMISKPSDKVKNVDRYLITGTDGYIGSHLKAELQKKYAIICPKRNQLDLYSDTINLDILIKEEKINSLIHLAHPRILNTTNSLGEALIMLKNVLDAAVENNCWLIYISSADVYGSYKKDNFKANETLKPFPRGINGETKWLCENLILHYEKKYNLKSTIVRSSQVYGPCSVKPHFIRSFIKKAKSKSLITTHKYANGYPKVDLLHIDDLVSCIIKIIKKKYYGYLNIGGNDPLTTQEIANLIITELGSTSELSFINIIGENCNFIMDISRASKEIFWQPYKSFQKEIKQIINGYI